MREIDPDVLATFDEEKDFISKSQRKFAPRVTIEVGHSWLVRFLPVKLGPKKTWYARIARHWVNRFPYLCKRNTSPLFGGDETFKCPICSVVEDIMASHRERDDAVRTQAFKASATPQWLTYVCVKMKDDEKTGREEKLTAHELWLAKTQMQTMLTIYKQGLRKVSPLSFSDFEEGNDFLLIRSAQNKTDYDKQEASPIFNISDPAKMKEWIDSLMASVKFELPVFPSEKKLMEAADKLEDVLSKAGGDDEEERPAKRKRPTIDEDEDEEDDAPPAKRKVVRDDDEEEPAPKKKHGEDEEEEESAPAPKKKHVEAEEDEDIDPDLSPVKHKAKDEEDEGDEEPAPKKKHVEAEEDEEEPAPKKKSSDEDEDEAEEEAPKKSKLYAPPAKKVSAPAVSSVDEDDDVTDEDEDPAPAAAKSHDEDEEEGDEAPPAVQKPKSKLSDRIAKGIASVKNR